MIQGLILESITRAFIIYVLLFVGILGPPDFPSFSKG